MHCVSADAFMVMISDDLQETPHRPRRLRIFFGFNIVAVDILVVQLHVSVLSSAGLEIVLHRIEINMREVRL